jgi:mannose-6-phosphate isomerase-like protein (cupin superfamily)
MRRAVAIGLLCVSAAGITAEAQAPAAPRATIMTAAQIAETLAKAGNAAETMTGTDATVAPGVVVRRRSSGGAPQYAIIHPLSIEIYQIIEGSGTLVTGGTLSPTPTTPQQPDLVRSTSLVGGEARRVAKGDVVVMQPGTPHWFSQIDGSITYLEARVQVVK